MSAVEAPEAVAARGPQVWPLSVNAYHAVGDLGLIPEKTELLYGQIIQKMSKSPLHTYLHQFLTELLLPSLAAGTHLRSEQPITCPGSEPEPDLAVVRGSNADYRTDHPRTANLAIEVCASSHEYDRSKLRAYAAAGVKECWLVLGPERQIEVHRQPQGEQYAERIVRGPGGQLTSAAVPSFTVDLERLFAA